MNNLSHLDAREKSVTFYQKEEGKNQQQQQHIDTAFLTNEMKIKLVNLIKLKIQMFQIVLQMRQIVQGSFFPLYYRRLTTYRLPAIKLDIGG